MKQPIRMGAMGTAAAVTGVVMALTISGAVGDDAASKRNEDNADVVMPVDDEDDEDTNRSRDDTHPDTNSGVNTGTGTNQNTNSGE